MQINNTHLKESLLPLIKYVDKNLSSIFKKKDLSHSRIYISSDPAYLIALVAIIWAIKEFMKGLLQELGKHTAQIMTSDQIDEKVVNNVSILNEGIYDTINSKEESIIESEILFVFNNLIDYDILENFNFELKKDELIKALAESDIINIDSISNEDLDKIIINIKLVVKTIKKYKLSDNNTKST